MLTGIGRRIVKSLFIPALLLVISASPSARAADVFNLDQRYGSIGFSTDHFGTFSSHGQFQRFSGQIVIDRDRPHITKVDVSVEAGSASIAWRDGTALLRGPDFFDAERFPIVRFTSVSVTGVDPANFRVNGMLVIRGISRPLTLDARLEKRWTDPAKGVEVADFVVTGTMSRSEYGMTAHRAMISDRVGLTITARIALPARLQ